MKNSKLILLLQTFQTRDFRRFREYLASPFFNKRQHLIDFYAALEPLAPDFSASNFTKPTLQKAMGDKKPISNKELTYLMNFLLQEAENYLAIESLQNDPTTKGVRILGHYIAQDMPKHYRAVYQRTHKALQQEPWRDAEWHLKAWRLADAEIHHFYRSWSRKSNDAIQQTLEHLDAFYLDHKLELGSEMLNLKQILQEDFDLGFIETLLVLLADQENPQPNVEIRKHILNILRHPGDSHSFFALRQLLSQADRYYPPEKVKGIFTYAQNYCIRRIKAGDKSFEAELFEIYQESLAAGVIYENGLISPWDFKNVCSIGLKRKAYAWVSDFITTQAPRLQADFRASAVTYNQANLYFHRKQYDQALKALHQVEFSDIFYALDTRRMMLMIYFEREDADAFLSLVASFRTYLRRNRIISEQNRLAYKNFVDGANLVFREWHQPQVWPRLREEIAQLHPLVEREWLMRKITAL